jgi:hypothetical protein
MGEYFLIANPDKRQYLDSNSLGMSVKLDGVIGGPLPGILVWLLADGSPVSGGSVMRGSWAGDRIIVAGDEGPSASVYQRAQAEFRNITIEAFEALAAGCSLVNLQYSESGLLDDDGRFIADWSITAEARSVAATQAAVTDDTLTVELSDGRTLSAPLAWYPRLLHATAEERGRWRLIGQGRGLRWPDLDEHISVENLLAGQPSGESQKSFAEWLGRRRGGQGQSGPA